MKTDQAAPKDIDTYIAGFPKDVQEILERIRMTIKKAEPAAEETISYNMPTFTLQGRYLIYFAAYKKHIAIYPVPTGDAEFNEKLSAYQAGKGTLQFSLGKPIPWALIRQVVKLRAKESRAKAEAKTKK